MAGLAKTEAFMLGTATVMLGPLEDLMDLDTDSSIGMVKNVALKSQPSFTDLTQGVKNTLVYSVMTGNDITVEGEVYEYTGRNLAYFSGLDGSDIVTPDTKGIAGEIASTTTITAVETGFSIGDWVMIQKGSDDQVMIRKISATAANLLTVDTALPSSFAVSDDVTVSKCNDIPLGSQADQPFLACKIVGTLANGEEAVILLPKVRITSGVSVAFKTDGFDHIPLAMKAYDLVTTDTFYTMFQTVGAGGKPAKARLLSLQ